MDITLISLWICIVLFALPALFFGFQKIKQNPKITENFQRWGYSKLFMRLLGAVEIITTIGLFFPETRQIAIYIYGIILVGAIFTHLKAKEYKELIAPICVLGLLIAIHFLNS